LCVGNNEIGEEAQDIDPTLTDLLLDPDTPASSSTVINPQDSIQPSASNAPTNLLLENVASQTLMFNAVSRWNVFKI